MISVAAAIIHDQDTTSVLLTQTQKPLSAILLDAVHCVIYSDVDDTLSSLSLNKELSDYITHFGLPVIVVSNATDNKLLKIAELLHPYSEQTDPNKKRSICSYANNPPKSDPQYFRNVIAYYQLDPSTTLYIDHDTINLSSAHQAGIENTLLYTDNMSLASEMAKVQSKENNA